jgi:hypothetical protein
MRMPRLSSILVLAAALAAAPAWAGNDPHGRKQKHGRDDPAKIQVEVGFGDSQRTAVYGWYAKQIEAGHCPPGLAKKRNGCLPPGQAKKLWALGRPLPREVIFHDLPPSLVVEIGLPPSGYRYARVANDVLLLAVGTGMVVDAITDLGKM